MLQNFSFLIYNMYALLYRSRFNILIMFYYIFGSSSSDFCNNNYNMSNFANVHETLPYVCQMSPIVCQKFNLTFTTNSVAFTATSANKLSNVLVELAKLETNVCHFVQPIESYFFQTTTSTLYAKPRVQLTPSHGTREVNRLVDVFAQHIAEDAIVSRRPAAYELKAAQDLDFT